MSGEGSGDLWAALRPPVPYPQHLQGFATPKAALWTEEENRVFEAALVEFGGASEEERCTGIAARIPGKSPLDVREHYRQLEWDLMDIESGVTELPKYADGRHPPGRAREGKSGGGARARPEERKKGVPWTPDEHTRFLEGLKKYGKGDWRSISRNSVVTRTPTQVASHAQKHFLRLTRGQIMT